MNKLSTYILIFLAFSCAESKKNKEYEYEETEIEQKEIVISEIEPTEKSIFDIIYKKIEDVECFKNFKKNSETVINYENNQWEYGFIELQNENEYIIILEKIIETGKPQKNYQILDTIHINNISRNEFISIGFCQNNGIEDSRIFTIIERTEDDFNIEYFSKIKRAWKVNLETKKIERMIKANGITCNNEGYGL